MKIDRAARCPSRTPAERAATSTRSTSACTEQLAIAGGRALPPVQEPDLHRRLPGRASTSPASSSCSRDGDLPRAAEILLARQRPARRHRPRLPAGDPVRGRLRPRPRRATRSPSATSSASSPTGRMQPPRRAAASPSARPPAGRVRGRRLRPGRPDRRRRAGASAATTSPSSRRFHAPGGVLVYGIPEFRLPKEIVQQEVDRLVADGRRRSSRNVDHRPDRTPLAELLRGGSTPSSSPTAPACRSS